jgi:hypothetical protein
MLKRTIRNLALTATTIASATMLTALAVTGASAATTTATQSGHAVVSGASATTAKATATRPQAADTEEGIYNFSSTIGCVDDLGHGDMVYAASSGCAYINFIDPVTEDGYTWYLIEMNGDLNTCLNYDISNDFVYADSCIPNDANELWEHHVSDQLVNLASSGGDVTSNVTGAPSVGALEACNNSANQALITYYGTATNYPVACDPFTSSLQWKWKIQPL